MSRLSKPIPGNLGNALMRKRKGKRQPVQPLPFIQLQVNPSGIVSLYGPLHDRELCYRIMCGGIEALNSHYGIKAERLPTPDEVRQLSGGTAATAPTVEVKMLDMPSLNLPWADPPGVLSETGMQPENADGEPALGVAECAAAEGTEPAAAAPGDGACEPQPG